MVLKTADEMLAGHKLALGADYGTAFHHCQQELWRVSSGWDLYETLFSTEERVGLLNKAGGSFWNELQRIMFENTLLGVCRLTDAAGTHSKRNLSVASLLSLDRFPHNRRLTQRVRKAQQQAEFARSWRDKRIAHNDFDQITEQADQLKMATRSRVGNAIVAIHNVLAWVEARYLAGPSTLGEIADGSAMEMLFTLADGVECNKRRRAEWRVGNTSGAYTFDHAWLNRGDNASLRYPGQSRLKPPRPVRA
ncbi:MAG: hypothetical protein WEB63_01330 [Cucumibacter sp.]